MEASGATLGGADVRWLCLILAVGCGRVGFDTTRASDATTVDGVMMVCSSPVGHDEDGDSIDDACDGCPHIADSGQVDGDGDGVNDVCDPQPEVAAERIEFFDAFAGGPRPEWTLDRAVTFTADALYVDARTDDLFMARPGAPVIDVIVIGGHIGAAQPTGSRQISIAGRELGPPVYECALAGNTVASRLAFAYTDDGVEFFEPAMQPLTGLLENVSFTLTMHHGQQMMCETTVPPGGTASAPMPGARAPVGVSHYMVGLEVTLEYAVQIRTE